MKRTLFTLSLVALVVAATAVVAQEKMRMEMGGGEMAAIVDALQLTPSQQAVFDSAHADFKAAAQPLLDKQRALGRQIETDLKSKSADACAIGGEMIAQHAITDQVLALHEQLKAKVSAVLTPEQKTKLEAISSMHERHAVAFTHEEHK